MPLYMRKDEHGYKFVRPIPQSLRTHFGKANFIRRLGKDYRKAKSICAEFSVETNQQIEAAKAQLNTDSSLEQFLRQDTEKRLRPISPSSELAGQLGSLWLHSLEFDAKAREEGLEDEEFEELSANIAEIQPIINRALASGQVRKFFNVIDNLLVGKGYRLNGKPKELQKFTYAVVRNIQTGYQILAARQEGAQLGPPELSDLPEPLRGVWELNKPNNPNKTKPKERVSDIIPLYEKRLAPLGSKSRGTNLSILKKFVDFTSNKELLEVTSVDIFNFITARLHDDEKPWSLGYATGRAKQALLDAFGVAKINGLIDKNPVAEMEIMPKISAREDARRSKPRHPYKPHHLNALFLSDWYKPDATNWHGNMKEDLGARYWIPLLCMWHGFRVGEATQLQTHDVNLKSGMIKIQATEDKVGPERSVKNSATIREIPIHPALINLGFLAFVSSMSRHYVKGPLFPAALPKLGGASPKWGRAYEQPFLRFTRDTLNFGPGYGNHSFRHALEDRIRAANLEETWPAGLSHAYTGRTTTRLQDKAVTREEGSEKHYGDGYEPSAILPYITKICYPGVDLPSPFKEWLSNHEPISNRLLQFARRWKTDV